MKKLEEYIEKHGMHFTVELAEVAVSYIPNSDGSNHKWNAERIEELTSKRVYYNTINASLGDIIYVVNMAYARYFPNETKSRGKCIDQALEVLSDVDSYEGIIFSSWLTGMEFSGKDFDFTSYI